MLTTVLHENRPRGTARFPAEYHYVDRLHPRYVMMPHWHLEYEFLLVKKGRFDLNLDGKHHILSAGDAFLIESGLIHSGIPMDAVYLCCVLDLERFVGDETLPGRSLPILFSHEGTTEKPFRRGSRTASLIEELFDAMEHDVPGRDTRFAGLLFLILGSIVSENAYVVTGKKEARTQQKAERIKRVMRLVRHEYAGEWPLSALAKEAGMSPKHFVKAFSEVTGRTPVDYLNYYRIEIAGELLETTDECVTEIAVRSGFGDPSYFTKVFRRYKKTTPSEYRKASRRDSGPNQPSTL